METSQAAFNGWAFAIGAPDPQLYVNRLMIPLDLHD